MGEFIVSTFHFFAELKGEAFQTAVLVAVVFAFTQSSGFTVARGETLEAKRFWKMTFRHIGTAVFVLGAMVIWRKELQGMFVALGAATAGFLIAFRENWLSMLAFWVRMVRRNYALNDFIEIDGIRGRVLDISWLSTVLAETSSTSDGLFYSGRVIHVPNNRFLLAPVMVENLTGTYSVHSFKVNLPPNSDVLLAEKLLMAAAERHCTPFYEEANKHMDALRDEQALDTPSVTPRSRIAIEHKGLAVVTIRMVVPFKERSRIEQSVLHEFLEQSSYVKCGGEHGEESSPVITRPRPRRLTARHTKYAQ